MTDASVTYLLKHLHEVAVSAYRQIDGLEDQIKTLEVDLKLFNAFLMEVSATKKPIKDETLRVCVKEVRKFIYRAEDIVAEFIAEKIKYDAKNRLKKFAGALKHAEELLHWAKEIPSLKAAVKDVYDKKMLFSDAFQAGQGSNRSTKSKKMAPIVEEDDVVGFQDEAERYINLLRGGSGKLEVVSIVGMPGLGKTTLAKMIFHDRTVEYDFFNRIWVYVSQDCNRKEVFLTILDHFNKVSDYTRNMTEEDLAKELCTCLGREKYLIVMDDVWSESDWKNLQIAFPKDEKKSRILITTRDQNVAKHANPNAEVHNLRFLTREESWTLLQKKALGSESTCPRELIKPGQHISTECGGLPLAIVVIGGILLEKGTESRQWEIVSKNVKDYITIDRQKTVEKLIAWSFYELPHHLRDCFIYFGMFPQDNPISVRKLILKWIAWGFIQQIGDMSLETIAEDYLEDLVNRNLVMVEKRRSDGSIKTCQVHDMIHVFCKNKAIDEAFYYEFKPSGSCQITDSASSRMYLCLSIHPHTLSIISPSQFGSDVRSFLCFSDVLEKEDIYAIPKTFKLLRVFDVEHIGLPRLPPGFTELVHLRYIVLFIQLTILPKAIGSLWNLQSLIVKTSSAGTLEIKADIGKLIQLRHLETDASTTLSAPLRRNSLKKLRTLSTISTEACTEDLFEGAPNLNKLGIRGQLAELFQVNGETSLFDNVTRLDSLENVRLYNDVLLSDSENRIVSLPNNFPPNLRKLTLVDTQLDWRHMSTLGRLDTLKILKLKENAFKGNWWDPMEGGFQALEVLDIGRTDLVSWNASELHFPNLKRLYLRHCTYLREVPLDLANISSLRTMELFWTTISAATSAKRIREAKMGKELKLSIYPPNHDQ